MSEETVDAREWLIYRTLHEVRAWADAMAGGKSGQFFDVYRLCDEALREAFPPSKGKRA